MLESGDKEVAVRIADRFPTLTLPSPRARLFWRMKVQMALAQSRIVLTVSDYAADQVSLALGVRRERIRVAVEAAAPVYQPSDSPRDIAAAARRIEAANAAAQAGNKSGAPA